MSEPVGNSPRSMGEVPGNSHKEREKKEEETRDKPEKIVQGKVTTRKPPWYKRFARSMVADDATSIGDYIMSDVIVPAIKNLIADIVGQGTNRVLFGTARNRRTSVLGGERQSLRTRYDRYSEDPGPRRMLSRESRARHDFNDVVLDSRTEAVEVVEALVLRVERYGSATVSDLYDYVGVTGSYADRAYGWTDLRTADVRQVPGGFLLDLPLPDLLR
jgi:hypothetical protein